jgi:hypothetical protein
VATLKVNAPEASQNIERDGMVQSGMEAGWRQSVKALGRLVEK